MMFVPALYFVVTLAPGVKPKIPAASPTRLRPDVGRDGDRGGDAPRFVGARFPPEEDDPPRGIGGHGRSRRARRGATEISSRTSQAARWRSSAGESFA